MKKLLLAALLAPLAAYGQPVPGSSIDVFQSSHDNLNSNANIQVNNADVNTNNRVPVDQTPTVLSNGAQTVATAGTAVSLDAADSPCDLLIMTAEDDNTGKIYYGGSTVSSSSGDYLFPAQKVSIPINNLSEVYIDADVSTEGVKYTCADK